MLVDHARQFAFAEAHIVDQPETKFAGKAGAQRNAGKPRRQRRLPFARHHQRLRVVALAQSRGQLPLQRDAEAAARQVDDDRLSDAGHVIGERRAQRAADDVDRPVGRLRAQQLHHRMAAHEIPDPDIGDDQDRRWRLGLSSWLMRAAPQPSNSVAFRVGQGQALACGPAACPATIFTVSRAIYGECSRHNCARLRSGAKDGPSGEVGHVFGHRRGRVHRIERGGQPQ